MFTRQLGTIGLLAWLLTLSSTLDCVLNFWYFYIRGSYSVRCPTGLCSAVLLEKNHNYAFSVLVIQLF